MPTQPLTAIPHEHGHEGTPHDAAHAVAPRVLLSTFAALMIFTFLTFAATWFNLGSANVWIALLIAVAKAGLVAMYFMHLRWDSPFNGIVLIASLFFVALFIGVAVLDSKEYQSALEPPAGMSPPAGIAEPSSAAPAAPHH